MLHRGIKFVHAALLTFSAVLAFLFVRGLDEFGVTGSSARVWAHASDGSASGSQVAERIAEFAKDHHVAVAREMPDLKNPDALRHLYLAPGDPDSEAASWLDSGTEGGYPAFDPEFQTAVHPISDLGQTDPRGEYYVFGDASAAGALAAEFATLGIEAQISHPHSYAELAPRYSGDVLVWSLGVVALAAITMTGAGVLLSAKSYGVLRLQGMSLIGILLRDLRQLARFWFLALLAVAAATAAFLTLYNGLAWLGLFTTVATIIAALLTALVLATHAAVISLTGKVELLRALKGELPANAASISVYLVRIPALILAASIAMSVAMAGQDVQGRQENREAYAKVPGAVSIRLNGSLPSETDKMITEVGDWLRRADSAGQIIVAGRRDLQSIGPGSHLPAGEVLIVNDTFLKRQPVLDPSGRRYATAASDDRVRLIVPASLSRHAEAIAKEIPETLDPDVNPRLRLETLPAKNGQRLFGYNSGASVYSAAHGPNEDRTMVQDPVIVAIPNGAEFLTNDMYTALATQEGVVFPDRSDALAAIGSGRLHTYVTSVRPISQAFSIQLRDAVNELRLQLFNLTVVVAVLLITGVGACIVYSRKNAQAIFVQHISGWRFTATHRFMLIIEGAFAVLLAIWVPMGAWRKNQELAELAAAGIPLPFPPVELNALDITVIGGVVVVEFCAVLLALAAFHRRIVKEGATEA
ncbi:hypothetical protein [Streptomyces prasinus]|uniref:hypothetical protein n=1 Tax=Streptomyces prasinus TaxID=67345 RepID=UPI0036957B1C